MKIQELQFELMKQASFNGFDGEQVVKSLTKNPSLWQGALMDRASYCFHDFRNKDFEKIDLIKLRDIKNDYWNIDTLYILPTEGHEDELKKLAQNWNADEVDWIGGAEAASLLGSSQMKNEKQILRIWWD